MAHKKRSFLLFLSTIAICAVVGGVYGPRVEVASAATDEDSIRASFKTFTKVYSLVEDNFADPVNPDKAIYKGAVPGMLRTLDPHSNFFDPHDFQILREDQKGHYYGVGMTVQPRNGKTIVLAPFNGSPAYKAGIRPGDVIAEVNDKKTDNLSTTEVADMLKGPRGTPVQIVVIRDGVEKPLTFNVIRDEISRKSVQDALWVKPGFAYVDVDQFNENTSKELEESLRKLGENNIHGLILDLRENPGGLLNEGVAVADHFLQKGQTIVSHRGRASAEKTYTARKGNSGHDYAMVVLVNRYSASAAEIVAGALQDHDRAWILGDNTFGKGLVQTVYPLAENSGLALTTAKYYTPSGRLIQRDYSNVSFFDYYYRKDTATRNPQDVKMTDSGRTVYGGGGISPDEQFVPKFDRFQTDLARKYALFNFTKHYFGKREAKLPKGWVPDEKILVELHDYLMEQGFKFTEAEWAQDHTWIKESLQREMYLTAFSIDESRRIAVETDAMVQKAVDAMPKARVLLDNSKKIVAQRMAAQTR
jgi:carboxyl-terminal processing protease